MALVEMRDVVKTFPVAKTSTRPAGVLTVLDHISLDVAEGEIFGLIGYSGAGKSTLVRLINGLTPATLGSIKVAGDEITTMGEASLRHVRQEIGMIFQQFNLFSSRTVWGNIAFPLTVAGVPAEEQAKRITDLLRFVGLSDKAHVHPDELSGGQKQRVGIARALATRPRLLLADEATSALDPETTREVLDLLRRVNAELGTTIVVITHEMEVIRRAAHRVGVLDHGHLVEQGDVYDILTRPVHSVTRRFVSTIIEPPPSGETAAALRQAHPGATLVSFAFADGTGGQAEIFGELARRGIGFEFVHGGVDDIQGRSFGRLTLALRGDDGIVGETIAALAAKHDIEELP
ncbi:MAG: ATP-binding cassette domain-containing protein [Propionibacteriaceae bacterium]|nr:ATP-binding cassette domain-containing protein [Propionibacteriaceae bacterium]